MSSLDLRDRQAYGTIQSTGEVSPDHTRLAPRRSPELAGFLHTGAVTPMAHIDPHEPVCVYCGHDVPACPTCPTCGCAQREAS